MGIINNGQYMRAQEAKKSGDKELMNQIISEEYGADSTVIDVEVEAKDFEDSDVLDDLASGIDKKDIAEKYGISPQKIAAIVRKDK